jgi:hypothetical protein
MTTTTTEKTGFKIVFEQHLSFMQPYEIVGLTVYDSYSQAMRIGKEVCKDMSCDSRNTIIKYIIAIPIVETVEIEHINYLS